MPKLITYSHKNKSGIYRIINSVNDNIYIGSSKDLYGRKITHISELKKNNHHSSLLQRFVNEHGIEVLIFEILTLVSKSTDIFQLEERYIRLYDPLFNTGNVVVEKPNSHRSDEFKSKVSKTLTGLKRQKRSIRHCNLISKNNSKIVYQYSIDGKLIQQWKSRSDAAKHLNISVSKISGCIRGEKHRHTAGGYVWKEESKQLKLF